MFVSGCVVPFVDACSEGLFTVVGVVGFGVDPGVVSLLVDSVEAVLLVLTVAFCVVVGRGF